MLNGCIWITKKNLNILLNYHFFSSKIRGSFWRSHIYIYITNWNFRVLSLSKDDFCSETFLRNYIFIEFIHKISLELRSMNLTVLSRSMAFATSKLIYGSFFLTSDLSWNVFCHASGSLYDLMFLVHIRFLIQFNLFYWNVCYTLVDSQSPAGTNLRSVYCITLCRNIYKFSIFNFVYITCW